MSPSLSKPRGAATLIAAMLVVAAIVDAVSAWLRQWLGQSAM